MYPCADGATPLPGICGWRHILRPANFVDVAQEAIETGLSSKLPPAVRHPPIPTFKRSSSRSPSNEHQHKGPGAPGGLQGQGPRPSRASSTCILGRLPPCLRPLPRQFAAARGQTFKGPARRSLKIGVHVFRACNLGFGVFPSRRKSTYIVYIWPTREGCASRCTGGARRGYIRPFSIGSSHCLTQSDVYLQCLTTLVMGGSGLSRPCGNLGIRV